MIIETEGLRKTFAHRGRHPAPPVEAVAGVDLQVEQGEIFGFLGPNGAGKTTTMRMLTTLLTPDAGRATVAGHDLLTQPGRVRRDIGFVLQTGGLWDLNTPREELRLQGRMQGLRASEVGPRVEQVIELLDLAEVAERRCATLSGGQRRRVEVGLGIVHEPRLVFLDEPSTGLDPNSRAALWQAIEGLRDRGVTVFLTTHYLDEADALCDRIAIVDGGQVVATGAPAELKQQIAGEVLAMTTSAPRPRLDAARAAALAGPRVNAVEIEQDTMRFIVDDGHLALAPVLAVLGAHDVTVTAIDVHRVTLDDVFRAHTGRALTSLRGAA